MKMRRSNLFLSICCSLAISTASAKQWNYQAEHEHKKQVIQLVDAVESRIDEMQASIDDEFRYRTTLLWFLINFDSYIKLEKEVSTQCIENRLRLRNCISTLNELESISTLIRNSAEEFSFIDSSERQDIRVAVDNALATTLTPEEIGSVKNQLQSLALNFLSSYRNQRRSFISKSENQLACRNYISKIRNNMTELEGRITSNRYQSSAYLFSQTKKLHDLVDQEISVFSLSCIADEQHRQLGSRLNAVTDRLSQVDVIELIIRDCETIPTNLIHRIRDGCSRLVSTEDFIYSLHVLISEGL